MPLFGWGGKRLSLKASCCPFPAQDRGGPRLLGMCLCLCLSRPPPPFAGVSSEAQGTSEASFPAHLHCSWPVSQTLRD